MEEEQIAQNHGKKKQIMSMILPSSGRPNSTNNTKTNINISKTKPLQLQLHRHPQQQAEEVKLAGLAISFNIRLRAADMPPAMQERALRHARALLDSVARRRPNPTILARSLKKEFDSVYGPAWHCVAGKSFGSFVTHSPGGFLYFSVDSFSFLLFKTQVHVIPQPSPIT